MSRRVRQERTEHPGFRPSVCPSGMIQQKLYVIKPESTGRNSSAAVLFGSRLISDRFPKIIPAEFSIKAGIIRRKLNATFLRRLQNV